LKHLLSQQFGDHRRKVRDRPVHIAHRLRSSGKGFRCKVYRQPDFDLILIFFWYWVQYKTIAAIACPSPAFSQSFLQLAAWHKITREKFKIDC